MADTASSREAILQRIRSALPPRDGDPAASYAAIPRDYVRHGTGVPAQVIDSLVDRLTDYDSEIVHTNRAGVSSAVDQILAQSDEECLLVPADFPEEFLPKNGKLLVDDALSNTRLEQGQAVLTTCEIAVAETGTIILHHGPGQGRRALTLLPDHHICIVRTDQVVATVPEAFARIENSGARPITTISGPSATSDIEMTRIRGVHGPRRLSVVLVHASA